GAGADVLHVAEHLERHARRIWHRLDLDNVVRLADRDGQRLELVIAVVAEAQDTQRERQLGVGGRADPMKPLRSRTRVHAAVRAKAAQSSSVNVSARAVGATPASSSTTAVRSPSTGRNERRSILRRCANPARTRSKSASDDGTTTGGVARRSKRTSAESTRGFGTNTAGLTA